MIYEVTAAGRIYRIDTFLKDGVWCCKLEGTEQSINILQLQPNLLSLLSDGRSYEIRRDMTSTGEHILIGNQRFPVSVKDPRAVRGRADRTDNGRGPRKITALMAGKVVRVIAEAGAEVDIGQGIIVIEAMKMQNELRSPKKGKVKQIIATEGSTVNPGDILAIIE